MDKLKQWVALTVVGVLAILAGGWFLLISPKKSDASDLNLQATTKEQANAMLVTQLATLKAQAKDLPHQQAVLAAVAAKVPDNPALPALIRALNKAAAEAGVELVSMAPGAPKALAAPTAAAPVTPAGTTGVTGSVASPAGAVAPRSAAAGVLNSIGVSLNVVGGYFQVEQFLDGLESLQRAFKVGGLTLAPGDNPLKPLGTGAAATSATGRSLTAAVTGTVYMATGRVSTAPAATTTAK
jgi:Tfp pilus assembly protein PilO